MTAPNRRILDTPNHKTRQQSNPKKGKMPHAPETEMALIGAIFHNEKIPPEADYLVPGHFYDPIHSEIYAAMLGLQADGCPVDIVSLTQRLRDADKLTGIGGSEYLVNLVESVPSGTGIPHWARLIHEKAIRREAINQAWKIDQAASNGTDPEELSTLAVELVSFLSPIGGGRARNELKPIPIGDLGSGEEIPWLWWGWLAKGSITLLIGIWKAGKSTLLAWLLRGASGDGDIAGDIFPFKALVVSEESEVLWARRGEEIGICDHVHLLIRPFKGRPTATEWKRFIRQIEGWVKDGHYDAVLFDTWQSINPCDDENDAAKTMSALTPLQAITKAGAAVLLVHHPRKTQGHQGTASRGSGALPGFVDIIAELRRYAPEGQQDARRKLNGLSRFDETPSEIVIELRDDGYHRVGSTGEAKREDRMAVVGKILGDEPKTWKQVRDEWPDNGVPRPGKRSIQADLNVGHAENKWVRTGTGKRGDPYKFVSRTLPP